MNKQAKIAIGVAFLVLVVVMTSFVFAARKQCSDGIDNDGDGHIDYPDDSKCSSSTDNSEAPRDFCGDSDGGNSVTTQGTVSGEDNSVAFSHTDFCVNNSNTLREYYCGGLSLDYNPVSTDIDCTLNFTGCSAGACV